MVKGLSVPSLAFAAMLLAGCGTGAEYEAVGENQTAAQAQQEVSVEAPAETQATPAPEPVATKPAPKPAAKPKPKTEPKFEPAPEPTMVALTVNAGTEIRVKLDQELSTRNSKVGDTFTATLIAPLMAGEQVAVSSGSQVQGMVTAVQSPEGDTPGVLKVDFSHIQVAGVIYPLSASVAEANPEEKRTGNTAGDVAKVGGGAAAGAILGRIIGKDTKGTLIGAAVGAAAGTAVVLATKDTYGVLPKDSEMALRMESPLQVTIRKDVM